MRRLPAAAAVLLAAMAGACGGSAGDILALEVSGGFQGEMLRLSVTEDGRGTCNGGELEPISNDLLIEAREVAREIEVLAAEGARFTESAESDRRTYVARTPAGTVRWVEGSEDLPPVLPSAALLAQELQEELCA